MKNINWCIDREDYKIYLNELQLTELDEDKEECEEKNLIDDEKLLKIEKWQRRMSHQFLFSSNKGGKEYEKQK